jgi:ribonucleotide reductase alpha subunit
MYDKFILGKNTSGDFQVSTLNVPSAFLQLPLFLHDGEIDYQILENTINYVITILDENVKPDDLYRDIRLGVVGFAELLIKNDIVYGSPASLILLENIMEFVAETAFEASYNLAVRRGSFRKFNSDHAVDVPISDYLKTNIRKGGIRNRTILGGNSNNIPYCYDSMVLPLYSKAYENNDGEIIINKTYKRKLLLGDSVECILDRQDVDIDTQLKVYNIVQKYADGELLEFLSDDAMLNIAIAYSKGTPKLIGIKEQFKYRSLTKAEALEYILGEIVSKPIVSMDDLDDCNCKK